MIECSQNIPCNPCQDACPKKCITIGDKITALPVVAEDKSCTGCGLCVAACSGQSIFLVNEDQADGTAAVTIPYEFYPLPEKGLKGIALDRSGKQICEAEVIELKNVTAFDHTSLLTMKVPLEMSMKARFFKQV